MVIDKEYLEQLRAQADEIRNDLAEREARDAEDHDAIMATCVVQKAGGPAFSGQLVHKTIVDARVYPSKQLIDDYGDQPSSFDDQPPFTDDQIDIVATVIAQIRTDMQNTIDDAVGPLRERIAMLEGQVNMLVAMFD